MLQDDEIEFPKISAIYTGTNSSENDALENNCEEEDTEELECFTDIDYSDEDIEITDNLKYFTNAVCDEKVVLTEGEEFIPPKTPLREDSK